MPSRSLSSLLILVALGAACGGDDGPSGTFVYPPEIWTGGEPGGAQTYSVPVVVTDKSATFSIDATGFAVTDNGNGEATLTATVPGEAILEVMTADRLIEVNVKAIPYTAALRTSGQAVYSQYSCGTCHANMYDNTSSAIAEHNDEALLRNIRQGEDPDGDAVRDEHHFNVPDEGVVAYIRSLPARGKPGPDL
jgi:hypothetical protein